MGKTTSREPARPDHVPPRVLAWLRAALVIVALVHVALLAHAFVQGSWILDSRGRVIPADFVSFWSTSLQLHREPAANVYDWALHRAAEIETVGPEHKGRFPWLNPPTFLFAVAPLALLPYPAAYLSWVAATFAFHAAALRSILPSPWTVLGACAFPAAFWTAGIGQNGFLTGALVASTLGLMERRPYLAGIALGLLTYKPQFGILFPIVLIADGRWRVVAAATATALLLALGTVLVFGPDTWLGFFQAMSLAQTAVLAEGQMGSFKLQSPYGAVLWLGGSATAAWTVQILATLTVAAALARLWRSRASFEVKGAFLSLAILVATPYAFIYDFPVLAVPIAFLARAALTRTFMASELVLVLSACAAILLFPFLKAPAGLLAVCLVAVAAAHRAMVERSVVMSPSAPAASAADHATAS